MTVIWPFKGILTNFSKELISGGVVCGLMECGVTCCRSRYVATCGMLPCMTFSAATFDRQFSISRKDPVHKRYGPFSRTESATSMVEEVGWDTLEMRRDYQSLCLLDPHQFQRHPTEPHSITYVLVHPRSASPATAQMAQGSIPVLFPDEYHPSLEQASREC